MGKVNRFMKRRSFEWLLLLGIVTLGLSLRLLAQNHLRVISPDGVAYCYHALWLAEGEVSFERRGPLFQLLLTTSYKIFGVSFESSILVPQFFGSIIPILLYFLGKRFFDSKTGLVAALLVSLNPMLINLSCWVLRETFILTLILTLILTAHSTMMKRSEKRKLIASVLPGFLTGLLILTREDMLFAIPPAYIAYIYFYEKRYRGLTVRTIIFLTTAILTITPWLLYSSMHFGDPFYSYVYYTKMVTARGGGASGTSGVPIFGDFLVAVFFGLWKEMTELPAILSVFGFIFLPIGVIFSMKKKSIWIIYFIIGSSLLLLSPFFFHARYYHVLPYQWYDVNRIIFSVVMPVNVIIAYGIRRFVSFVLIGQKNLPSISNNTKHALLVLKPSRIKYLIFLGLLILGVIAYVPPYSLTLKDFTQETLSPFIESAEFLNSSGGEDGVFTAHPELLARYYKGPIYQLPQKGGFEYILEEAKRKGVRYLIIESTCVSSREFIKLYYNSVDASWRISQGFPSEFGLVKTRKWKYGIYYIQTQVWFKAAIFSTSKWDANTPWESILTTMGASTRNFDDTISLLDIDLSEFDLVVFADFLRPLSDAERLYLEESIEKGLTVVVSGLSPPYLAGGTSDLTCISTWFGATVFSEAPKEERWKVKFTESAIEIMTELDLEHEYAFYTNLDWSTPTGCVVQPESVVYAYRVNDGAETIFLQKFGEGTSIFIGPRDGFDSPDKGTFKAFLQSLIRSVLAGTS